MASTTTIEVGEWLPFLLQTADPLFPVGGYAHSLGLEEMVRLGSVRDEASLLDFLMLHSMPLLRDQELPYLRFAHAAAAAEDLAITCALDREIDACKLAEETREASIQIGVRRLRALENICPGAEFVRRLSECVGQGKAFGHHLIVAGAQAAVEAVPLLPTLYTWAYQALASACAAALKLIRIGQDAIQRALRSACARLPTLVSASLHILRDEIGCFSPALEIASMRHQRADERLFIS